MSFPSHNPTKSKSWQALVSHYEKIKDNHMNSWFEKNPERINQMTIEWEDFYVDFSKNRLDIDALRLLLNLAHEVELPKAMEAYFSGQIINRTENRAVLHTALRNRDFTPTKVDRKDVMPEIKQVLDKIKNLSDSVVNGALRGYSGKPFETVVNIGIGGSDLGPAMVVEALSYYSNHLETYFVSNVDGDHVNEVLKKIDPETTLFVIVSKTFTTQETLSNATTIRKWFLNFGEQRDIPKHFVAVSTNIEKVKEFGIVEDNIFPMWDWVGGRFSLWSAVGLSISLSVGYKNFELLLDGAHKMDLHFKNTELSRNIPVVMGLLNVWYNNFFNAQTHAVIPYSQYLNQFATYLQQGIMESNGKNIDRNGNPVTYQTGTIIWGEPGTNSQHAFFQLIHQGTKLIPADFIGFVKSLHGNDNHHNKLMSNFFAQTEALLKGRTKKEVLEETANNSVAQYKVFEGNKPTTTILIDRLTPESLGKLIAMYEHQIFVEGVIWNIYSYDQFGVELGKQLASSILNEISEGTISSGHDSSTFGLLAHYLRNI